MTKTRILGGLVSDTGLLGDGTITATEVGALPIGGGTLTGNVTFAAGQTFANTQASLVSGTNIKTINGNSVLGSGNIQIDGGVTSFNTRTGAITLGSGDVTTALGFTPVAQTDIANSINALVDTAPGTLDTLNELAAALGDDPNFATTVASSIATKLPLSGGTLTGNVTFAAGQTWPTFNQNTTGTAVNITANTNSTLTTLSSLSLPGSQVSGNILGRAANVTGTVAIDNGGTGATTRQAAMDALAGAVTSGQYLRGDGTDVVMSAIQAADVPTLNQNTTGNAATATTLQTARTINGVSFNGSANVTIADSTKLPLAGGTMTGAISFAAGQTWPTFNQNTTGNAANVTGTVAIANGGTGATTRQDAMDALAGAVTSGQYLRGNGTDVVMSAIQAADVPTLNQNTTGNAATATTFQTARTINGVSFNGSANITVADSTKLPLAGGTMTGAISFAAGQTWPTFNQNTTGTASAATNILGGSAGTIPYQSAANTTVQLAAGTSGQVLRSNGAAAPSWVNGTISGISLGSNLNTLTLGTSGTGLSGSTTYNGSGAATFTVTSNATNSNSGNAIVARDGSGNFSAGTITATLSGTATTATNLAGGSAGTIPYQSAAGTTVQLAAGTSGQFLRSNGAAAPSWVAAPYSGVTWRLLSTASLATTIDVTISTLNAPLLVEFENVYSLSSGARTPSVAFRQVGTSTFWSFPSVQVASTSTTTTTTSFGSGALVSGGTTPLTPSIPAGNIRLYLSLYFYPDSSSEVPRVTWTATYSGSSTSMNPNLVNGGATASMFSQVANSFDVLRFTGFIPSGGSGFGNVRVYQLT